MAQHPGLHAGGAVPFREMHYTGRLLGMQCAFGISVSDAALPLARLARRSVETDESPASAEALGRWESEGGRVA